MGLAQGLRFWISTMFQKMAMAVVFGPHFEKQGLLYLPRGISQLPLSAHFRHYSNCHNHPPCSMNPTYILLAQDEPSSW